MKRYLIGFVAMGALAAGCDKKQEAAPTKAPEPVTKAEPAEPPKKEEPKAEPPKKEEPKAELPPAKGAWKPVPNIAGMVADVPTDATPNGVGGAAGFHKKDGSFQITLNEVAEERKGLTLDQAKAEIEQFAFKKWIKAEATSDGWVVVHELAKLDDEGNVAGTVTAFGVRRKIGDKLFDCSGGLDIADGIEASIASCNSVTPR